MNDIVAYIDSKIASHKVAGQKATSYQRADEHRYAAHVLAALRGDIQARLHLPTPADIV